MRHAASLTARRSPQPFSMNDYSASRKLVLTELVQRVSLVRVTTKPKFGPLRAITKTMSTLPFKLSAMPNLQTALTDQVFQHVSLTLPQLVEGFALDLANSLAANAEVLTDFG